MNGSVYNEPQETYIILEAFTCILGFGIFIINLILVIFTVRIIKSKDKYGIIIHTLSVCINDMLCGLVLFLIGIIRVEGLFSVYLCVYTIHVATASYFTG